MTGRWRLTSQRLFALTLGAMVALIVLGSVAGAVTLSDTAKVSDRLQDRISPAGTAVVQLGVALVDQETGVRGYLLSGDRQFLVPYDTGIKTEQRMVEQLRQFLRDEPVALADVERLARDAERWRSGYAEPLIAAKDPRSPLVETGKAAFDRLRAGLATLQRDVEAARTAGRSALADARERRDTILLVIIGGLLAGLAAIAVLLQSAVLRPLQELRASVRRVADGDFDHRLPSPGPPDLAELAADVEAMRDRVVAALAESRSTEEQLRRSNSDLEQFAYVASHDLQEPLRKIASFCQMLQRRYGDQLDDRARQYIAFAVDGATRMQALINDLLAFSRVGRVYDNVVDVDLARTFARVRSDLADADAVVDCAPLPVVQGDPTLLSMLWQNLLSNAVKFGKPGEPPRITVAAEREDAEWRFAVQDRGIGIEPQFNEKIFVIFQRLHPRDVYSGTGIGLAICKRIVEHHGGRIWLDQQYADGARICFTLPATADAPA
ncbi:sensor histidine kinase [Dactylosporangium fulvum]|uniref:histidine kinase n=1 Tax=Dactylosporangium fulvum TaxID=53359 RepID=A0ABY5VNK2_9ACTN|nr:ATP-binding protein [Dactylosporangium fulvum]UWP79297.1 CHASE3 domain-containing protein [Dactylosporangium fulvum]